MLLYSVCTTYHLIEAITHKCKYNKSKNAKLLITTWLAQKYYWYDKLKIFFNDVIVFEGGYDVCENIKENLDQYYDKLFEDNNICIDDIEEIHVFGAEHSFGAYVTINSISHSFWEEGAGALGKPDAMLNLFEKLHGTNKAEFQRAYCLHNGESDCVAVRYYDKYFQDTIVEGENLIHFDVGDEIRSLIKKDIDDIIALFGQSEKIQFTDRTCLLLTECFANQDLMTWEEQQVLYYMIVDYFLSDYHLLVKPHPDDLMPYERMFGDTEVLRKRFPAELLPVMFDKLPECVATISSTSIYGLKQHFDKVLEFDFNFSHNKHFYRLHRYFVGLSIADLYKKAGYKINVIGVDQNIINNFANFFNICKCEYNVSDVEEEYNNENERTIWIIDEVFMPHCQSGKVCSIMEKCSDRDVVMFMNSDGQYCFYDYNKKNLWDFITPVGVEISTIISEDIDFGGTRLFEDDTEMLYMYCKGELLKMDKIKRELPNVGVTVESVEYSSDQKQIKILEGMLEATEKRLLYYLEKEKEQE